jgi:hypothetical protein
VPKDAANPWQTSLRTLAPQSGRIASTAFANESLPPARLSWHSPKRQQILDRRGFTASQSKKKGRQNCRPSKLLFSRLA